MWIRTAEGALYNSDRASRITRSRNMVQFSEGNRSTATLADCASNEEAQLLLDRVAQSLKGGLPFFDMSEEPSKTKASKAK